MKLDDNDDDDGGGGDNDDVAVVVGGGDYDVGVQTSLPRKYINSFSVSYVYGTPPPMARICTYVTQPNQVPRYNDVPALIL